LTSFLLYTFSRKDSYLRVGYITFVARKALKTANPTLTSQSITLLRLLYFIP